MRTLMAGLLLLGLAPAANADEIVSVYTDIDVQKNCTTFDINVEGGEFANFACNGYGGYPVLIYSADLRESLYYGFPRTDEHVWESFAAFNSAGPKIEWRVSRDGDRTIPFATIHRRFVSDPEDPDKKTEVLVVAKVGLVKERDGCTVGLVLASGNPQANETARRIADEQVRDFACGADERVMVGENLPSFDRQQN